MSESEIKNAAQFPKHYYMKHMQPGICGYGTERVLVDTDAVKKMLGNNAVGKPCYVLHQKVELDKLQEKADGYITESFYNELDGWGWFKVLIVNDAAHAAIAKGWKCSNAYMPTQWGSGATKNNVPFDREIMDGEFTHIAIVPDPRYEEADIKTPDQFKMYQAALKQQLEELQNSKTQTSGGQKMFKLFKTKREEVQTIDAETHIELENGKSVTIGEMINAVKNNEAAEADEKINGDSMVECEGEKMPLKELVNRYNNAMKKNAAPAESAANKKEEKAEEEGEAGDREKKNAEDEAAKKKKEKEDAEAEEKKNREDEEKRNANFTELQNAHNRATAVAPVIVETGMDKLARGKSAYGSGA